MSPSLGDEFPFQGRRFTLEPGVEMHYLDEGPRTAPTLLLLHGNPTWSFFYRRLISELSVDFRCIAPDHVGLGLSSRPAGYAYRLERHAENLGRLVDELGLREVVLVVHDWGGAIGLLMASRRPGFAKGLVILNTAAFSGRIPLRIRLCRVPLLGELLVCGLNAFARAALWMAVTRKRPLRGEVAAGFLAPYPDWRSRAGILAFVRDIPDSPEHPSWEALKELENALPRFRDLPALLLWGARDFCFTPAFLERWRRELPDAEVRVFPDAGHYLLEEASAEILPLLRGFLARHAGGIGLKSR